MFKYLTDWACPIKRMFYSSLGDFGISTYDILVFIHFNTHVLSVPNAVSLDPKFHLFKTFASPNSADQRIGDAKENIHQSSAHREVVILKLVPLWRAQDILSS